jgi:hypothetical protein
LALKSFYLKRELRETDLAVEGFPLVLYKINLVLLGHFAFNPFAHTLEVNELHPARAVADLN